MNEVAPPPDLGISLDAYKKRGGVLDFAFFDPTPNECDANTHREAAREFLDQRAAATREFLKSIDNANPLGHLFKYNWNESKLHGNRIPFDDFWGSDDVE